MIYDISAGIGRNASPLYDYDFTQEYLMKLRGVNYIPVRKKDSYTKLNKNERRRNYLTPRMQSLNNHRYRSQKN